MWKKKKIRNLDYLRAGDNGVLPRLDLFRCRNDCLEGKVRTDKKKEKERRV